MSEGIVREIQREIQMEIQSKNPLDALRAIPALGMGQPILRQFAPNSGVMARSMTQPLPENVIATSEEMRELVSVVRAISPTNITVLLIGESGTGKEVFAQLIHDLSDRHKGPFVTVNCGAIPEGLIESELFGHEKGSFTGAINQRKGFFEAAQGGTIFLDEIGEMPLPLQVKLLRVLETGKFTRVGSTTQITTDARVVAATNRDLEIDVRAGRFRSDLYYRLRAVMLRIPPLRNRRNDIPFLIEALLEEFVKKHHLPQMPQIAHDALEQLMNHEWRGNIRELRNTMEQLVVLVCSVTRAHDWCVVTREDVDKALGVASVGLWGAAHDRPLPMAPAPMTGGDLEREVLYRALIELRNDINEIKAILQEERSGRPSSSTEREFVGLALPPSSLVPVQPAPASMQTLAELESAAILKSLDYHQGNRRHAAHALGISERTLYRKLKEMGYE